MDFEGFQSCRNRKLPLFSSSEKYGSNRKFYHWFAWARRYHYCKWYFTTLYPINWVLLCLSRLSFEEQKKSSVFCLTGACAIRCPSYINVGEARGLLKSLVEICLSTSHKSYSYLNLNYYICEMWRIFVSVIFIETLLYTSHPTSIRKENECNDMVFILKACNWVRRQYEAEGIGTISIRP